MQEKINFSTGRRVCLACLQDVKPDEGIYCKGCAGMTHFERMQIHFLSAIAIALQRLEPGRKWTPGD